MSVNQLSAENLGAFVAVASNQGHCDLKTAVRLAQAISVANALAWANTYPDTIDPISEMEIESAALRLKSANHTYLADQVAAAGYVYNTVANNGRCGFSADSLEQIRQIESQLEKWAAGVARHAERERQNSQAYECVDQLPTATAGEIESACKAAGCQRVIVASYRVDESESQSDYWGSRQVRQVVIGFGKGKRENFKQLRKAAATFAPTAHMGPGLDPCEVSLIWDHDHDESQPGRSWIRIDKNTPYDRRPRNGHSLPFHWYSDEFPGAEKGRFGFAFNSIDDADEFIENHNPLLGTQWDTTVHGYENRETYSMGHGNYLGSSRHGTGWQVNSCHLDYATNWDAVEVLPGLVPALPEPEPEPEPEPTSADDEPVWAATWL